MQQHIYRTKPKLTSNRLVRTVHVSVQNCSTQYSQNSSDHRSHTGRQNTSSEQLTTKYGHH